MNIRAIAERIGMDYDGVMEYYCGDVAVVKEKLMQFPESASLEKLEAAIEADDETAVRKEAHAIRKAAEKLGLQEMAKAASAVEEVSRGKLPDDFSKLKAIQKEICSVLEGEA